MINLNFKTSIQTILQKNHFLTVFDYPEIKDTHETTLPFKKFKLYAIEQFIDYLKQHMKGHGIPQMSARLQGEFRKSLVEIFENSTEHSHSEYGIFVCGQWFPNDHKLKFMIADAGVGIPKNVSAFLGKTISSAEAVKWVLRGKL